MGYRRPNGEPDLRRFCLEHRYDKTLFYYWIKDQRTPTKELDRLAEDLKTSPAWLLFGVRAITGGIDLLEDLSAVAERYYVKWRAAVTATWRAWFALQPQFAPAV
jgi:hypothetical protein